MSLRHIISATLALLCLAACNKEPESAVDNGTWDLESHKNTAIKPGDDFNLYCNGTWVGSIPDTDPRLEKYGDVGFFSTELPDALKELEEQYGVTYPVIERVSEHLSGEMGKDAERLEGILGEAVDKINAAQTKEELWVTLGELMKEGYQVPFYGLPMNKGGKTSFMFMPSLSDEFTAMSFPTQEIEAGIRLKVQMMEEGKYAPATRVDPEKWPLMAKVCEGLGVKPEDACIMFEEMIFSPSAQAAADREMQKLRDFQESPLEQEKEYLTGRIRNDRILFDQSGKVSAGMLFVTLYSQKHLAYDSSYRFAQNVPASIFHPEFGREVFRELVASFSERLDKNTWLSPASKTAAREKLMAMNGFFGYPEEFYTDCLPDYTKNTTAMEDFHSMRKSLTALAVKLAGKPSPEAAIHAISGSLLSLNMVNAGYIPKFNSFMCLPIWLTSPVYDPAANSAYNFAILGCVCGHEITHGFDTNGSQYDKNGDVGSLYTTSADATAFNSFAQKLIDFHNNIEILPGVHANGAKTIDEDIADLGGFEIAFQAYTRYLENHGFTGETKRDQQRKFYEAFANIWRSKYTEERRRTSVNTDDHSLSDVRINALVPHTDAWYDLYNIQPGDKLYIAPENRIHIW